MMIAKNNKLVDRAFLKRKLMLTAEEKIIAGFKSNTHTRAACLGVCMRSFTF